MPISACNFSKWENITTKETTDRPTKTSFLIPLQVFEKDVMRNQVTNCMERPDIVTCNG